MHEALTDEIVKVCRQRVAEGDCPTIKRPSGELLEAAIIDLAKERDELRAVLEGALVG